MLTLKVISALLCYPQADMQAALDEMAGVVSREALLPPADESAMLGLIRDFASTDLLELQERYVALFDQRRALSLHLFEHVHGESRDRGQAMVNLLNVYRGHGFAISARELPDYLPLVLEYLSQRPRQEACALLADAMPVISLLGARLQKAGSPYHILLGALQSVAGAPVDLLAIQAGVAAEGPDRTLVEMDQLWEEEVVSFARMPAVCQTGSPATVAPVQWRQRPFNGSPTPAVGAASTRAPQGDR